MALYISKNGKRLGPYSSTEVQNFLNAGTLQGSDLAWFEGSPDWTPLAGVPGIAAPLLKHQGKAPSWERVIPVTPSRRPFLPFFFTAVYLALAVGSIGIIILPNARALLPLMSPVIAGEMLAAICLGAGAFRLTYLRRSACGLVGGAFVFCAISIFLNYLISGHITDPGWNFSYHLSMILCGIQLLVIGCVAYLMKRRSLP